jgi:hypothetical protein
MTPERIEEIEFWYRVAEKSVLIKYVRDLLAALEEAEQQKESLCRKLTKQELIHVNYTRQLKEAEKENEHIHRLLSDEDECALEDPHDFYSRKYFSERNAAVEEMQKSIKRLAEAQQTIDRLTAALIAERDDAITWDGIGTVNRINKVLEGETQP